MVAVRGRCQRIQSYEEFRRTIPIMRREEYAALAESVFDKPRLDQFYIGASSGSTGGRKLVLRRSAVSKGEHGIAERELASRLRHLGVFRGGDVVVNLFAVQNFSILHHGACTLLEAFGCDIVPPGDFHRGAQGADQLRLLARLKVNVLFGTPSSLIQVANLCRSSDIYLQLERIVFAGEALGTVKRKRLASIFGAQVRFWGLYGLSECGFVGISGNRSETYTIIDSAFFLERDRLGEILITSLDERAPVPIVRYATGDTGILVRNNGVCFLSAIQRLGIDFNYMGNLVSYDVIKQVVARAIHHPDFSLQIELSTKSKGVDQLTAHIFSDRKGDSLKCDQIRVAICNIAELAEGEKKGAGHIVVTVHPFAALAVTANQKEALVIDHRNP